MREFFQNNLDIVFFIYGLAFVVMGLAIVIQPRQDSSFKIGKVLWFLGAFGLTHGFNEWLDMWAIIRKDQAINMPLLDIFRWLILIVSFYFFLEFGRRLLKISLKNTKRTAFFLDYRIDVALILVVLLLGFSGKNFMPTSGIWARYLLAFPGGLLTALGLVVYYHNEIKQDLPGLRGNFYYSAISLFIYSILGGLVVAPADFFPASVINTVSFLNISFGIPVQVFRALCAVISSIFIGRILTMFKWEVVKNLCRVQTERFTDKITSSIEEMIMVIDKDFRIKWANAKLKAAYGKEILNSHCYEVTHRIKEPCRPPNDVCPVIEAIRNRKSASVIHTHLDKAGKPIYVEVSAYPMLDEGGRETGDFIHTSRDVTGRIKAQRELEDAYTELKAIQEKLLSTEKMASLGKLSAGIAHEINNPIGFVISNLSTLEKYTSSLVGLLNIYSKADSALSQVANDEVLKLSAEISEIKKAADFTYIVADLPKLIKETLEGAGRVVKIIKDLKSFSHKDEVEFIEADINEIIESALNIVWSEVKYKVDVVKEYGALPKADCYPQQITQAIMNIVVNAAQAIEKSGRITIRTYAEENKIYIEISDTGAGMSAEVAKMIFEPFFTTKKVGEGTGLGLAIVYGIVQKHKGNIEVKSKVGEGSTFIISLPVKAAKAQQDKK